LLEKIVDHNNEGGGENGEGRCRAMSGWQRKRGWGGVVSDGGCQRGTGKIAKKRNPGGVFRSLIRRRERGERLIKCRMVFLSAERILERGTRKAPQREEEGKHQKKKRKGPIVGQTDFGHHKSIAPRKCRKRGPGAKQIVQKKKAKNR